MYYQVRSIPGSVPRDRAAFRVVSGMERGGGAIDGRFSRECRGDVVGRPFRRVKPLTVFVSVTIGSRSPRGVHNDMYRTRVHISFSVPDAVDFKLLNHQTNDIYFFVPPRPDAFFSGHRNHDRINLLPRRKTSYCLIVVYQEQLNDGGGRIAIFLSGVSFFFLLARTCSR